MISSAVLQSYTGSSDTATLALLESGWVAWLQTWIPRYLGTSKTLTEVLDGPRGQHAWLTGRPADDRLRTVWLSESIASGSLVSVKYRDSPASSWADLSTDSLGAADLTDYEIHPYAPWTDLGSKLVRLSANYPAGLRNLQIKYTHGYAEDAGPDDVKQVLLDLVKGSLDAKTKGAFKELKDEDGRTVFSEATATAAGLNGQLLSLKRRQY